jgi:hydroxymethylpyrimidine/phosphomethylpyrimidine kinase
MGWGTARAFEAWTGETPPVAVVDDGDVGKEPMAQVFAADHETLGDRLCGLADAVADE